MSSPSPSISWVSQKRQISPSLHASLQNLGLSGIYSIWPRIDLKSKCFRTSAKGGPSWKDVEARVTLDASNGNTIKIEATRDITREREHCFIPGGPHITTLLIWRSPTSERVLCSALRRPSG